MEKKRKKQSNPIAKSLYLNRFKQKIVKNKKAYDRKKIPSPINIVEGIFFNILSLRVIIPHNAQLVAMLSHSSQLIVH